MTRPRSLARTLWVAVLTLLVASVTLVALVAPGRT